MYLVSYVNLVLVIKWVVVCKVSAALNRFLSTSVFVVRLESGLVSSLMHLQQRHIRPINITKKNNFSYDYLPKLLTGKCPLYTE